MKIAHVVEYFMPQLGYQEYYLTKAFQDLGHETLIITSDRYRPFPDYHKFKKVLGKRIKRPGRFEEKGLAVIRLPVIFEWTRPPMLVLKNLMETLEKFKPDVVQSDGLFAPIAFQTALLKEKLGYKLFYDTHASSFNTNLTDTLPKKIYHFIFKTLAYKKILKSADGFSAVGESEQEMACREYGLSKKRVPIILLGADTENYKFDQRARTKLRKKFGLQDKEVLIFHGGKLTPQKDTHILLESLALLKRAPIKILILGTGEEGYIQKLKKIISDEKLKDKVIFENRTFESFKEVPIFASAADLGVFPGDLAGVIQESMSCSLPVILPKIVSPGQTSDHLLKNGNGLSFKRGDKKELAEKIEILVTDYQKRKLMRAKSRQLMEKEYSWRAIADQCLKQYQA